MGRARPVVPARKIVTAGRRLPIVVLSVIVVAGAGCASLGEVVSLPTDIRVTHPSSDLPAPLAALSGRWDGRWGGTAVAVLIVERVNRQGVGVIYAFGGSSDFPPWTGRVTGQVTGDRGFVLRFSTAVVHFQLVGDALMGESRRPSGELLSRITMVRFPSQPGLVTLALTGPPGAEVSLDGSHAAPIGPDGTYRITVSPRVYQVEVSQLGFEPWRERLDLTRGQARVERRVSLTPLRPPSLSILEPVPDASVVEETVRLRAEVTSPYRLHRVQLLPAAGDPISLAPPPRTGPQDPWRIDTRVSLNPGLNRMTLEVEDEHGGKATHIVAVERRSLPTLELRAPPGTVVEIGDQRHVTDESGRLRVALPPGTYEIHARKEGFQPLRIPITLSAGETASIPRLTMVPVAPTTAPPTQPRPDVEPAAPPADAEPPRIAVNYPPPHAQLSREDVVIVGLVTDNVSVDWVELTVNGVAVPSSRDITVRGRSYPFRVPVLLRPGENVVEVTASDQAGNTAQLVTTVVRVAPAAATPARRRWAVVVGVGDYDDPSIPRLRFAGRDAEAMYRFLTTRGGYPPENVLLLTDGAAIKPTLQNIRRALGDFLSRKPERDDMVLVYFAGHGAPDLDASGTEADGVSRYLVPRDAEAASLYATAFPMDEIDRVFRRIAAERVVVLLDTCYSGAAGGRTFSRIQTRSPAFSDVFLERLTRSRGRLIITASGANEVALELDELSHGLFTHYVLEGLGGKADRDGDGVITVSELYEYVEKHVEARARAAGGRQRPLMKGEIEGSLPLAEVRR
ncbi:MAG: caspase family protein [Candidatus Rokubacteria bacterium]|nr:caspase family protein [Candidatus Rokubacteria bacterium]